MMENKNYKLSDNKLENVNGGQAVLPLLSSEEDGPGADNIVGVNRFGRCRNCGNVLAFPPTGSGVIQCECGAQIKY